MPRQGTVYANRCAGGRAGSPPLQEAVAYGDGFGGRRIIRFEEESKVGDTKDPDSGESAAETTSVFRADFLNEVDSSRSGEQTGEQPVQGVEGLPPGAALLVVKRGPNAGSRFLLDQPTTSAGRHPDSDIFLDDVTVSRRHAEFRQDDDTFQVVDVGSLNGTYVNREPVDSSELQNGDEVQIGKFRLVFLTGPRSSASEPAAGAV